MRDSDPRAVRDVLQQTGGQQTGGHHAVSKGLVKAVSGPREANSQWRSEFGLQSRNKGFLNEWNHSEGPSFCLAGGVQSVGVAYVDKTCSSFLALNCRGHLQQRLNSAAC